MNVFMNTPKIILLALIVAFNETGYSQETNAWGETVVGAQLSINLDTNTVSNGMETILYARIRNISTNSLYILNMESKHGTFLCLTNANGKSYQLFPVGSPSFDKEIGGQIGANIPVGGLCEWSLTLKFMNIEAGKYDLYARRNFYTSDRKPHEILSNLVKVQVK